jgi:hypothetical protein
MSDLATTLRSLMSPVSSFGNGEPRHASQASPVTEPPEARAD